MKTKIRTRIFSIGIQVWILILFIGCNSSDVADPDPNPISAPTDYKSIAAGYSHSIALEDKLLYCAVWAWGDNTYGQLGDSTRVNKNSPEPLGHSYIAIDAGGRHSLALAADSTLWAWGNNEYGQLGDNTFLDKNSPTFIGSGFSAISAGFSHSLALKYDGTLWAWGDNAQGQIGDGTNENKNTPVQIGSGFSSISAGGSHSLARKTNGTLMAWGNNEYGQLGDGTNERKNTPVQIGVFDGSISAGSAHSLAWTLNGMLWAWGNNQYGQLGDGTNFNRNTPVQIASESNAWAAKVAAGESHSLVLYSNGNLWACGKNDVGQLGDATIIDRNELIKTGSGYVQIEAGGNHSFGLKEETVYYAGIGPFFIYHLWAWGSNLNGQLGDRFVNYIKTPKHMGPL